MTDQPTACSRTDDPTEHDAHDCEPTDDGTACRHCGAPAQRADLTPDALALLIAAQSRDGLAEGKRWTIALTQADIDRRRAARRDYGTLDGWREPLLAEKAHEFGLVPDPAHRIAVMRAEARDRMRATGDVWAGVIAARAGKTTHTARAYEASDSFEETARLAGWTRPDWRQSSAERSPLYAVPFGA